MSNEQTALEFSFSLVTLVLSAIISISFVYLLSFYHVLYFVWYMVAFLCLTIGICWTMVILLSKRETQRNNQRKVWYKKGDIRASIGMLLIAPISLVNGIFVFSSISNPTVLIGLGALGIGLICSLILVVTSSIQSLYRCLKFSKTGEVLSISHEEDRNEEEREQ